MIPHEIQQPTVAHSSNAAPDAPRDREVLQHLEPFGLDEARPVQPEHGSRCGFLAAIGGDQKWMEFLAINGAYWMVGGSPVLEKSP